MANYILAIEQVFGLKYRETSLPLMVLRKSACWHTMSDVGFSYNELEKLFKDIYCLEIWNELGATKIVNQSLAEFLFQEAIVTDVYQVVQVLQATLNLTITGSMNQETLMSLKDVNSDDLTKQLKQALHHHYFQSVLRDTHLFSGSQIANKH